MSLRLVINTFGEDIDIGYIDLYDTPADCPLPVLTSRVFIEESKSDSGDGWIDLWLDGYKLFGVSEFVALYSSNDGGDVEYFYIKSKDIYEFNRKNKKALAMVFTKVNYEDIDSVLEDFNSYRI